MQANPNVSGEQFRPVQPRVHPDNQLVGEPHYFDPMTVAWVERIPPTIYRTGGHKRPRWTVEHLKGNEHGGSMHTSTTYLRTRKAALEALEHVKGGRSLHEAEDAVKQRRRQQRLLRG